MKSSQIKIGGLYTAKVNGKLVTVRVTDIREGSGIKGNQTHFYVTNLSTGRKTIFRSAQKFHKQAGKTKKTVSPGFQRHLDREAEQAGLSPSANGDRPAPTTNPGSARLIQVQIGDRTYTYSDPTLMGAKVGDTVTVPGWRGDTQTGQVVALGSNYTGEVKEIVGITVSEAPTDSGLGDKLKAGAAKKPAGREPTEEQRAILETGKKIVKRGGGVLVIEAGAGTGKTTTDRMLADVLPGVGQYTAFNASLTHESAEKFRGTKVQCNTTHSLAFRAEGNRFAHRLEGYRVKSADLARMLGIEDLTLDTDQPKSKRLPAGWLASQVMGAIRRFCQSADREVSVDHFRYIDGIDMPSSDGSRQYSNNQKVREYLLPFGQRAWADLSDPEGQLPFSHDCYVKIWQLNNPVISADYILLDEAQDTAPVMLDILRQQKATVILVGDSAQQIYEWRGAVNAMAAFPDAPRLFLSQSFRFGQAIADVANRVLETLAEQTPLRLKGLKTIPSKIAELSKPKAILTRTNACAVNRLLTAIAEGRRPFLVGGGSDVIAFIRGAQDLQEGRSTSHPDLACFASWAEVQEYATLDDGEDLRLMVKLINAFGCQAIPGALTAMPEEKDADLVISTAHKSKGREWDEVQLAADFPTKSKCQDADRKLLYVAVTRAKLVLDVSECPFFTGKDSLKVDDLVATKPDTPAPSVVPPAPSNPPKATNYTWSKSRDGQWLVRGPAGNSGREVQVERKDGSTSTRRLGAQVACFNDGIALYQV